MNKLRIPRQAAPCSNPASCSCYLIPAPNPVPAVAPRAWRDLLLLAEHFGGRADAGCNVSARKLTPEARAVARHEEAREPGT